MKSIAGLLMALALFPAEVQARIAQPFRVLVFSKTAAFRHDSIPQGIAMIQALGTTNNFTVTATEDASAFTEANLRQYRCVVFLSTTGDVLNDSQQSAFEAYIRHGGGFVGIHAASDTEYNWPWYGQLVGAYFQSHPAIQSATIKLNDLIHPSTHSLPKRWTRADEWYVFNKNPRGAVHVLATLDENSYSPSDRHGLRSSDFLVPHLRWRPRLVYGRRPHAGEL